MIRIRSAVNLHGQDLHLIVTDTETGASVEFTLPPALAWRMLQGGEVIVPRDAWNPPTVSTPEPVCKRDGCPQPMHGNHYHCGRCDSPAITGMMGHMRGGVMRCTGERV